MRWNLNENLFTIFWEQRNRQTKKQTDRPENITSFFGEDNNNAAITADWIQSRARKAFLEVVKILPRQWIARFIVCHTTWLGPIAPTRFAMRYRNDDKEFVVRTNDGVSGRSIALTECSERALSTRCTVTVNCHVYQRMGQGHTCRDLKVVRSEARWRQVRCCQ